MQSATQPAPPQLLDPATPIAPGTTLSSLAERFHCDRCDNAGTIRNYAGAPWGSSGFERFTVEPCPDHSFCLTCDDDLDGDSLYVRSLIVVARDGGSGWSLWGVCSKECFEVARNDGLVSALEDEAVARLLARELAR